MLVLKNDYSIRSLLTVRSLIDSHAKPVKDGKIMKLQVCHIINPYIVREGSEESVIHQKTIQSLLLAREYAKNYIDVTFVLKVDKGELDFFREKYSEPFFVFHCIERNSADLGIHFNAPRSLPVLSEIFKLPEEVVHPRSQLIFTNMDICVQPFFYCEIVKIIKAGFDCFVINRRTVPKDLLYMPLEEAFCSDGEKHIGHDCFVLPTRILSKFNIRDHLLGIGFVFRPFLLNCILHGENFHEFDDVYMTFHYGDDMDWKSDKYADYLEYNRNLMIEVYAESKELIESADERKQEWIKKFFPFDFLPKVSLKDV